MKNKKLKYHGIAASSGVAFGRVYKLDDGEITPLHRELTEEDVDKEYTYFSESIKKLKSDLQNTIKSVDGVSAEIIEVHLSILNDPVLDDQIKKLIIKEKQNASWAFYDVMNQYIETFSVIEDKYLRERVSDLKDIKRMGLAHLASEQVDKNIGTNLSKNTIIVAKDILPSDMIHFTKQNVVGFAVETGGDTSHSVIVARSLGVPGVTAISDAYDSINEGDEAIVDGVSGVIIINPTDEDKNIYKQKQTYYRRLEKEFEGLKDLEAKTLDGKKISLLANIEMPFEVEAAINQGAEGIGLFRTEYLLFMNEKEQTEEDQFTVYNYVSERMKDKIVTFRSFDIGGDKIIDNFLNLDKEKNSFMGLRAIRILLKNKKLFKNQLRAFVRASVHSYVRILLPFITNMSEIDESLQIIEEVKEELINEGFKIDEYRIYIGIMVEVPSAAIMLDDILRTYRDISFVSIGTNDLTQFLLAVDRGNKSVSNLYNPYHPSLLRTIHKIVLSAHKYNIKVEVCGELANSQNLSVILLGMGVDELSMAPFYIPFVKKVIRTISYEYSREIVDQAMKITYADELERFIKKKLEKYVIDDFVNKRRKN